MNLLWFNSVYSFMCTCHCLYMTTSELPRPYMNYLASGCMSFITEDPFKCPFTDISLETITVWKSLLCSFPGNLIKFAAVPRQSHKSSLSFRVHLWTLSRQANYVVVSQKEMPALQLLPLLRREWRSSAVGFAGD